MKKNVIAILFLLMGATIAVRGQKPAEWIRFSSTEGRYSVLLPAQPKIGTQEASTPGGVKFTQYTAMLAHGNGLFMIGYFDHVPGTTFSIDMARDSMVAAVKGTLISESIISLDGNPGRALRISAKTPEGIEFVLRSKFYDVNKRVYVLQFIIPKPEDGIPNDENAARFFESFQLTNKP